MLENEAPLEGSDHAGLESESVDWLAIVKEAYKNSTEYLDTNHRKQFEKNVALFRSSHPAGSKYYTDAYKARSKLFRPKTRAALRRTEAAFAEAAFATSDVVNVVPADQADKNEDHAAELWQALLNHRLVSMPWYQICVGAYQESKIYGIVCSRQDWEYEEQIEQVEAFDPITQAVVTQEVPRVIVDRPRVELIPIENIRFDSGASWIDPVNTSPYFIELMPMYVNDVLAKMEQDENKTREQPWKKLDRGQILSYGRELKIVDTTRTAREGGRQDPKDSDTKTKEFEIVWVFRCFVSKDGTDYEFYTLTDKFMLTEPSEPSSPLGRPYRIGVAQIEAHRCIPSSDVEVGSQIQAEINDTVNQRIDNVRLALNKGKFVRRNADTDLITLRRSYPGRIVMTRDPTSDIIEEQVRDVTQSSYAEQERLNADFDDILGGFSQGSVATARNLNETVGGMQLLNQSANTVLSYGVRTFVETWMEPVLRDMVRLIQEYESDELLAKFAEHSMAQIQDRQSFVRDMLVTVSIGFGPLDPQSKVTAVVQAMQALAAVSPQMAMAIDGQALAQEIFGSLGFRNGMKFFGEVPEGTPEQAQGEAEAQIKQAELQLREADLQLRYQDMVMRGQLEQARIQLNHEAKMADLALKYEMTMQSMYSKLQLDEERLDLSILKEMSRREQISRDREEMILKTKMGSGI